MSLLHTTSPSYLRAEAKNAANRQVADLLAIQQKLPRHLTAELSPILVKRELEKACKHTRLVQIAEKQFNRESKPIFAPFVVADSVSSPRLLSTTRMDCFSLQKIAETSPTWMGCHLISWFAIFAKIYMSQFKWQLLLVLVPCLWLQGNHLLATRLN